MTFRSIWRAATKQGYVSHDPFDGLVLPRLNTPEQRFFTVDEMARIIDAAPEPSKVFYWLAAETGMRAGELCGLRWIDVCQGFVQVRRSVWRGKEGAPKSGRSVRSFAISPALQSRLLDRRNGASDLSYVFHSSTGSPLDSNLVVKRKLRPLLRNLGIEAAGLHAFRHGNETFMDRTQTPLATRLSRLGHSDTRMMVNYSHVISEDDRQVSREISKLIAPKCAENAKGLQDVRPVTPVMQ